MSETLTGFIKDEGLTNSLAIMGRALSRACYLKKLVWLMPRMNRAMPRLHRGVGNEAVLSRGDAP